MQLRQIQVAHDKIQDRLTLRIATQANEEFRIYITRRFLRKLWPRMIALITGPMIVPQEVSTLPGDDSVATASFDEPFQDNGSTYPLGMHTG